MAASGKKRPSKIRNQHILEYQSITKCRVCEAGGLIPILDLGNHPLANSLKSSADQPEEKFPLTLSFCPNCSLAQLNETVAKEKLFKKYVWVTGTSSTANNFAQTFYKNILAIKNISKTDLVVEIASNDGTFLRPFANGGFNAVGVEPAENIAQIANSAGIKTINAFWCRETAQNIISTHGNAKVIFARNVIPHVSELHDVIDNIRLCLADDGVGAIEFHYAGIILRELQYDSIYHEHLCYFSIKSIEHLLNKFGLMPYHIDLSPISGGAYIIYFSKEKRPQSQAYRDLSAKEDHWAVNSPSTWNTFAEDCKKHKALSKNILKNYAKKIIVGFGSSARSSTYLNFCEITSSDIKAIIDNSKLKQGLFSAGSSIPIISAKDGFNLNPDIIFILAWNFCDEIMYKCKEDGYKGDFLVSFPNEPKLVRNAS